MSNKIKSAFELWKDERDILNAKIDKLHNPMRAYKNKLRAENKHKEAEQQPLNTQDNHGNT